MKWLSNESNRRDPLNITSSVLNKGKARLTVNLVINSEILKGFIILHRFLKIHIGKIQSSHDLKDPMKEISPHNVKEQ